MAGPWRTFIHLKGVGRLRSKTSNVAELMEAELFLRLDPREESHPLGHAPDRMIILLDVSMKDIVILLRVPWIRWSFSWACPGRMVILLGVLKEDEHSLARA